ncbi:LPS translocon maturation chaperone LptM [Thalassotalea mangrovi]|uniref:Lipopeptide n=1 Tax=Thalassotalea mangrovi TaxID=2572245 RepID=A0A4U1B5B7_9GAMM|nr:lipoprotein [Thalassotalea mangrovi]TKB45529.1 lipopeptide [Thalassotalea mangrovi]
MLNKKTTFAIFTGLMLLVSGCGQKGPLYQTPDSDKNQGEQQQNQSKQ